MPSVGIDILIVMLVETDSLISLVVKWEMSCIHVEGYGGVQTLPKNNIDVMSAQSAARRTVFNNDDNKNADDDSNNN